MQVGKCTYESYRECKTSKPTGVEGKGNKEHLTRPVEDRKGEKGSIDKIDAYLKKTDITK